MCGKRDRDKTTPMQLSISFDEQEKTVYAELRPGQETEEISLLCITKKLDEAGYHDINPDPQGISVLIEKAQQETECKVSLKKMTDAMVAVSISSDKLQALLTVTPEEGAQALTLDMITAAIADVGIVDSLVDQTIVTDCLQQQSVIDVCIAQAQLPENGRDSEFIPLVEGEVVIPPDVDDHGVADMVSTHQFLLVDINTPVMKRIPATEGQEGMDVVGVAIKPKAGKEYEFSKKLSGVVISPEDPNVLLAEIKGHPIIVKHGVNIDPVLHVENVDLHTGNITFDGSLEVKGDVAAGVMIEVTGDVCVRGAVEHARIKAGQNIRVGGGIWGEEDMVHSEKEPMDYHLEAGADIEAGFVTASTMKARNNIMVKEYIMNSIVKSGNQVLIGHPSGKGILIGGTCEAGKKAVLKELGNETDAPTRLVVGQLSKLYVIYQKLKKELGTRLNEIVQLEKILDNVEQSQGTVLGKISVDKVTKIENTITAINDKMARLRQQLLAVEPEIEEQKKSSITVRRVVYPNVVMTINDTHKRITEKTSGRMWIQLGNELIEQKPKG